MRESLAARRVRAEKRLERRDDALTELLATNSRLALALVSGDPATQMLAFEMRARASVRLLLTIDDFATRSAFADLMNRSLPHSPGDTAESGTEVGASMSALQDVLVRWSAGELTTASLLFAYESKVSASKRSQASSAADKI